MDINVKVVMRDWLEVFLGLILPIFEDWIECAQAMFVEKANGGDESSDTSGSKGTS